MYLIGTSLVALLSLALSRASLEIEFETLRENHTGNTLADVWKKIVWNRFPQEIYPLFLSPLISAGRIREAQERSRVHGLIEDEVESYSGYITVDEKYDSNMFFWFFPQETQKPDAPVLLWLNGGPGRTSFVGALAENGPYEVTTLSRLKAGQPPLHRRKYSWTQHFSMLYVENPVDVGYSFTRKEEGYSTSTGDTAKNLYSVLVQFFKMFPQYSKNDFYIGGQASFTIRTPASTCQPWAVTSTTVTQTPLPLPRSPQLQGHLPGAGYCDPMNMMPVFPEFLYNTGFISNATRQHVQRSIDKALADYRHSNDSQNSIIYLNIFFTVPINDIGLRSADHILGAKATNDHLMAALDYFMNMTTTRIKLHAGFAQVPHQYMTWSQKAAFMIKDFLANTSKENAFLMDHYKVMHYSGNLDIVVNVPMTEAFLQHVPWSGQQQYRDSVRRKWRSGTKLLGWTTTVGNFTRVIVRNAGHMVPYDQPEAALEMMRKFVFGLPFQGDNPLKLHDSVHKNSSAFSLFSVFLYFIVDVHNYIIILLPGGVRWGWMKPAAAEVGEGEEEEPRGMFSIQSRLVSWVHEIMGERSWYTTTSSAQIFYTCEEGCLT